MDPVIGGSLILGGTGLLGSILSSNAASDAAAAAAAAAEFDPRDISTGIGSVVTGPDGQVVSTLSPEYQAYRDRLLGLSGQAFDQFQTFDPMQAAGLFTNQLTALASPQEQQQRLAQENRLAQQGLLSSTLGMQQQGSLQQQQNLAHQARVLQGYQYGQQAQQGLFNQGLQALQGASALDTMAANQLSPYASIGGAVTAGNTTGANFQFQAGMNNADMISSFFGSLGQGAAALSYGGYNPNYALNAPAGGNLSYTSGGYGGTGMGSWYL